MEFGKKSPAPEDSAPSGGKFAGCNEPDGLKSRAVPDLQPVTEVPNAEQHVTSPVADTTPMQRNVPMKLTLEEILEPIPTPPPERIEPLSAEERAVAQMTEDDYVVHVRSKMPGAVECDGATEQGLRIHHRALAAALVGHIISFDSVDN
jgi:hypothetical protein